MNYDTWTKADLIAEIQALNHKIEERIAKRQEVLEKEFKSAEKAMIKRSNRELEEDKKEFKRIICSASEHLIAEVFKLSMKKAFPVFGWVFLKKHVGRDPQDTILDELPFDVAYHFTKLQQQLDIYKTKKDKN